MQEYGTQIEKVARERARSQGLDPEQMDVEVDWSLSKAEKAYLKDKGFENFEGSWSVQFAPRGNFFGGLVSYYFRYPELSIIEEYAGE